MSPKACHPQALGERCGCWPPWQRSSEEDGKALAKELTQLRRRNLDVHIEKDNGDSSLKRLLIKGWTG